MESDRKAIGKFLKIPSRKVRVDRYLYDERFPDELKAWKFIGGKEPELRTYKGRPYYPETALMVLVDQVTELLVRKRFVDLDALPGLVDIDMRFRKPVVPEGELLIQVKLLRNYKDRLAIFSGVIVDKKGDIVAENISKGALIQV
jgi:3-hydroxymyristoyl/3-hydroxydecanoyl-(acyl carrier protein) dehydratase